MAQNWAFATISPKDQSAAGGTSMVITKPTGTADGDLLFACVEGNSGATQTDVISGPAGWTLLDNSKQGASNGQASTYWKIASGEGASWTWTITAGSNLWVGFVARYTSLTSTPADAHSGASGTGATLNAPDVTTTAADDLVTRSVVTWNATSVSFASGTSRLNAGSNGDLMRLYDSDQAAAGAVGTDLATANAANPMSAFTATFLQSGGGFDPATVPWPGQMPDPVQVQLVEF